VDLGGFIPWVTKAPYGWLLIHGALVHAGSHNPRNLFRPPSLPPSRVTKILPANPSAVSHNKVIHVKKSLKTGA